MSRKTSKKTEKIELRISPEAKARLAELGRARGESVSEMIRALVDRELGDPAAPAEIAGPPPSSAARPAQPTGDRPFMAAFSQLKTLAFASVSVVALGVGWSLASHAAASAQAELRMMFAAYDHNADGVVTRAEFEAHEAFEARIEAAEIAGETMDLACEAEFARLDAEEAAAVAAEEEAERAALIAAGELDERDAAPAEDDFTALDGDGDHRIDFEELQRIFVADREEEFNDIDVDFDGFAEFAEFAEPRRIGWAEELAALRAGPLSNACADAIASAETLEPNRAEIDARIDFAALDENRDGRVSRAEFVAR